MKKIISLMAFSLLFANNANAEANTYVSLKYGNGSGTETIDYTIGSRKGDFDMSEISLGIGFITSEDNRIEINYNTMDTDGYDFKSYGLDYIKSLNSLSFDLGKVKVKPEVDVGLKYYSEIHNRNALGAKLGLGVVGEVSESFEMGLGYEYRYIKWESVSGYYGDIDISDEIFDFTLFGRFKF